MVRDPFADEDDIELQDVLDALDDPDCRKIVAALEEPMTVSEISDETGVPLSTTYRKLDLLMEAELLIEETEIRPDGQHASRYDIDFEEVVIQLTDDRRFEATIARRARTADRRLEELWAEVRKET
ncbi:MAG: helix-turn-helix domain-containing protein [Haloarculaceae archaeon]